MNYKQNTQSSQVNANRTLGKMIILGAAVATFWSCTTTSGTLGPTPTLSSGTNTGASSVVLASSSATVLPGLSSVVGLSSAVVASSASTAGGFTSDVIWTPDVHGSVGAGQVLNSDGIDGGWWYSYTDATNDGGSGTVSIGNTDGEWSTSIEDHGKIVVTMNNGVGAAYPFTGIGFNWISDEAGGEGPFAITTKTGLCVRYKSTAALSIELKWDGNTYGYATFQASLPKTATETSKLLLFSTFKRGYTDKDHPNLTITDALTNTTGVQIKFAGAAGTSADLELSGIGFSGACPTN